MKYILSIIAFSLVAILFGGCGSMVTIISSDGGNPIITIDGQKAQLPAKVCFKCNKKVAQIKAKYKNYKGAEVQILNEDNPNYENSSVNSWFLIFSAQNTKQLGIQNGDKKAKYVIYPAYPKCE